MQQLNWYKVFASPSEAYQRIPKGKLQLVKVGKRRICIAHTDNGFHAVADTCPHLGAALSKGHTNYLNEVICPWHEYRFNLVHGTESDQRTDPLEIHKIELREDGLFLGLIK